MRDPIAWSGLAVKRVGVEDLFHCRAERGMFHCSATCGARKDSDNKIIESVTGQNKFFPMLPANSPQSSSPPTFAGSQQLESNTLNCYHLLI